MKTYTLGFLFDHDLRIALVRKKRGPGGQKDKLNGFGGKLKDGESPVAGMIREFVEESGVRTSVFWHPIYGIGDDVTWKCYCFAGCLDVFPEAWTGDESVEVFTSTSVLNRDETVQDVMMLLLHAITKLNSAPPVPPVVTVAYTNHRGVTNHARRVWPTGRMWFGSSRYHLDPQWHIEVHDVDKNEICDFACSGIHAWSHP